jgi:hypothetical protein
MAKYSGSGWHFQSVRHSNARKYGRAGGTYAKVVYDPANHNAWVDLGENVKEKKRFINLFSMNWSERPTNNKEIKAKASRVAKERGIPLIEK